MILDWYYFLVLFSNPDEGVEIRRLNTKKNDAKFILDTWKYAAPGSEIEIPKCIERNASGGVFVDGGKCVCGVYIASNGFLSGLYCLPEYRKNGYAKLAMNYTFKEYAKDGCVPCLTVEHQNPGGIQFFSKLGLKVAAVTYGVFIKKLVLDKWIKTIPKIRVCNCYVNPHSYAST